MTSRRTQELEPAACLDPGSVQAGDERDFAMDLENGLGQLPTLEAKIIDLYYFQHKTMEGRSARREAWAWRSSASPRSTSEPSPGIRANEEKQL